MCAAWTARQANASADDDLPDELGRLVQPERAPPADLDEVVGRADERRARPSRRATARPAAVACSRDRQGDQPADQRCPAMMTMPPIVGVPIFSMCPFGPSSRMRWPHPHARNSRIATGCRAARGRTRRRRRSGRLTRALPSPDGRPSPASARADAFEPRDARRLHQHQVARAAAAAGRAAPPRRRSAARTTRSAVHALALRGRARWPRARPTATSASIPSRRAARRRVRAPRRRSARARPSRPARRCTARRPPSRARPGAPPPSTWGSRCRRRSPRARRRPSGPPPSARPTPPRDRARGAAAAGRRPARRRRPRRPARSGPCARRARAARPSRSARGRPQRERRPAGSAVDARRPRRERRRPALEAEPQHRRRRPCGRTSRTTRVVGVQHRRPVGRQRLGELGLRVADVPPRAEQLHVRDADVRHDADAAAGRPRTAARMCPMPARAHLEHQHLGVARRRDRTVSGSPISLLNDAGLRTRPQRWPSTAAVKSFVHVFPVEPVMPDDRRASSRRSSAASRAAPQADPGLDHANADGARPSTSAVATIAARRAGRERVGDEVVRRRRARRRSATNRSPAATVRLSIGDAAHHGVASPRPGAHERRRPPATTSAIAALPHRAASRPGSPASAGRATRAPPAPPTGRRTGPSGRRTPGPSRGPCRRSRRRRPARASAQRQRGSPPAGRARRRTPLRRARRRARSRR